VKTVVSAAKRGEAALTWLVESKVRPVLVLNDPPASGPLEMAALRLLRLARLGKQRANGSAGRRSHCSSISIRNASTCRRRTRR
jgi:hypothetical protein